eukprot:9787718-Lingulodinium_polyedra.AAC.1
MRPPVSTDAPICRAAKKMDGVESNFHGNANTTKGTNSPCPRGGGGNKPKMRLVAAGSRLGL